MSAPHDRAELEQLQEEWMASMQQRDMPWLEELVASGFRFTAIHLDPDPSRWRTSSTPASSGLLRLTDVWSRRDGRWQVVARHWSVLA